MPARIGLYLGSMVGWMDRHIYRWMDGETEFRDDEWVDGWMEGWTVSGWMYTWIDKFRDGLRGKNNIVAKAAMVEKFSLW